MAEEIQEAVQIIRVAYDGIEIAMKVGSGGLSAMQKAAVFFKDMLDYEKSLGKATMRKLLMKGGDLQVLQFQAEERKKVEKMAKKYGILYAALPDINPKDGMSEILFHTEAVPRVNMMLQKLNGGRIAGLDDYLKNGDEKQLSNLTGFLKGRNAGNGNVRTEEDARVGAAIDGLIEKAGLFAVERQSISVDAVKEKFHIGRTQAELVIKKLETMGALDREDNAGEHKALLDPGTFLNRVRGYQELAERMQAVAASKNRDLSDVTVSRTLIVSENSHAVKTKVPGTWGKTARYVWIKKENIMDIHGGKTMLTFIDNARNYKLYDEENRVVETKTGEELYRYYDKVEFSVRERYEKMQAKETAKSRNAERNAARSRTAANTAGKR